MVLMLPGLGVRLIHGTVAFGSQLCGSVPAFCRFNVKVVFWPFANVAERAAGNAVMLELRVGGGDGGAGGGDG